jgi:hypothetical protein
MKLPRPRLTIRRLMVLVAIAGLILGAAIPLLERRRRFARIMNSHWAEVDRWALKVGLFRPETIGRSPTAKVGWHAEMASKYRHAARYPWLPVWPDPPEPE